MGKEVGKSGEVVREFILRNTDAHPHDIVALTASKFGCSRQAVHEHIRRLIDQGAVESTGARSKPTYRLAQLESRAWNYSLVRGLSESDIWKRDIYPELQALPKNVLGIRGCALTEMINNAIDHSGGWALVVTLERTAVRTTLSVYDDGDLFEVVVLDFKGGKTIGQAFADEIFCVYARSHPDMELHALHASRRVADMIARARSETLGR